ncbi:unnamed protein product [Fraxinus pennsylvanica]|uniref:Uncharacterized protein n=1 Tax=Fraxinus pennsylvanica TaxID=56036 RepID=A0AAD2DUJ7_9LAMI|nr:unnamed protein product [Fraxinus pennsylvanica]
MGLIKKLAGFLGFARDEGQIEVAESADASTSSSGVVTVAVVVPVQHLPRKGFSVPVQVVVERAQLGLVIVPCNSMEGDIQGLRWYGRRLMEMSMLKMHRKLLRLKLFGFKLLGQLVG